MKNAISFPAPRAADAVPNLEGKHVRLRAIRQSDYPFLIELQSGPENMIRWRYRGTTPSPEHMVQSLWQGVLAQFLIVRADNGEPVGLVAAYDAEFRHSYAWIAMIVTPRCERAGWTFEAYGLFTTYLFETFGFRKVYLEVIEFNFATIASGTGRLFHVEGCLVDHEFHLGRRWNLYTVAIYADEWTDLLKRLAPHLLPPERVIA
jgi:RimJ/RimL family protein N-acetyltransferase